AHGTGDGEARRAHPVPVKNRQFQVRMNSRPARPARPCRPSGRRSFVAQGNRDHLAERGGDSELAARIAAYELAFRMQAHAPEAVDVAAESEATRRLYGLDRKETAEFGLRCLLARRLVERGVRCVQLYCGDTN